MEEKKKKKPSKFSEFADKELTKHFDDFERKRKKALFNIAIIIVVTCIIIVLAYILEARGIKANSKLLLIVVAISYAIIQYNIKNYKEDIKNEILPKLLSLVGEFHNVDNYDNNSREYIKQLNLFGKYNSYTCDDKIKGKYKLLDVDISEIKLQYNTKSKKEHNSTTIFKGLFITVPCNKKFQGFTIVKFRNDNIKTKIDNLNNVQKVVLEDTIFNKYYEVYSTDQVEARYLITTAFMERLKFLVENGIAGNINISFELGKVNIAVSTQDINWFEVPILEPANNINNYKDILYEIKEILKIIDSLKLEQNIGL